jgi:3-deoxy-D-manno-octulosonic-acid transferase
MVIIYDTAIFFYHLLIRVVAPFHKKANQYVKGRKNWQSRLKAALTGDARYIWFHCSSLGEFEQGRPVIEAIKKEFPQYQLVLSFFSPSGYEIRKNYGLADVVCYLPPDTRRNASGFIEAIRPEMAFFVKYEFWHHYINALSVRHIPLYLISGIFRKDQRFFSPMPWGRWFRKMLGQFTHFFLQDEHSARLLEGIGLRNLTISGDTRFDRVAALAKSSQLFPIVDKFSTGKPILIAGSTWEPDEKLLVPFINQNHNLKYIIAPHEISFAHLNRLVRMLEKPTVLFSMADPSDIHLAEVIIIDSVGLLSSLYRYGSYAYIGGGFGAGIHNILEAATFGMPVFFGPRYKKFREACQLNEIGGAIPVNTTEEFSQAMERLIVRPELREKAASISSEYVKYHIGATEIILSKTMALR